MSITPIQATPARQYKGMRYVPIFDGDWDNTKDYDPLVIVSYQGNSYTSRTFVPHGTPITDEAFWVLTGNYNAQVEAYRQEVANLNTEVLKIAIETGSVLHLFPNLSAGGYTANSSLMVTKNHCILFDAGSNTNKNAILNYYNQLYNDEVFDNIDTIVISHYHHDHVECLEDILNTFPHENCEAYIAMNPAGYYNGDDAETIEGRYNTVKSVLENASVTINEVTNDTNVNLSNTNVSIELFNSSATDYTYYSANTDKYNDYSMVALVKVGNIYAMYPGDIQNVAQTRIVNNRDLPKLFLYSIHHHGIQNNDNVAYLNAIRPEYGVLQTSHNRALVNYVSMGANYGVNHILSCAYSSQEIVMDGDSGYVIDGVELQRSGYGTTTVNFYVNNEYAGTIHDGTIEHPFTSINEFNAFAVNDRQLNYVVHVKATDTPYDERISVRQFVSHVTITKQDDGTEAPLLVNSAYISNCREVSLSGITFIKTFEIENRNSLMYIENSSISIGSCIFDGSYGVTPAVKSDNAIRIQRSDLYITNCTIKNVGNAFEAVRIADVTTNVVNFDNVTNCYLTQHVRFLIRGLDTINDVTNYLANVSTIFGAPVEFSDVATSSFSAFNALIQSNSDYVCSLPFRNGNYTCQVHGKNITGTAVSDLNDALETGVYRWADTATNRPSDIFPTSGGNLIVTKFSANYLQQIAISNNESNFKIACRKKYTTNWTSWVAYEPSI